MIKEENGHDFRMSEEILLSADVWALGCLIIELILGIPLGM